jgi:hypothetical protein
MDRKIIDPDIVYVTNVRHVDTLTNQYGVTNYLFRGALPLTGNAQDGYSFNYQGLRASIKDAAPLGEAPFPDDYQIYDINLLQWENADEVPKIETEYNFFLNNPQQGTFMFWETKGTGLCPLLPPLSVNWDLVEYLATNLDEWISDTLVTRTQALHDLLENFTTPTVIYVHCEGGDDRTGEIIGAYYMRWLNMSWSQMNERNQEVAGGPFGCNNFRAALWYAIYLYLTTGRPDDFNTPFQCNDGGTPRYKCGGAQT